VTQRPMLGDLELETVRRIEDGERQVLVRHEVPALEGDFLQRRGRDGARVALTGVVTGPGSAERLRELRVKVRTAEPVPFLSDVTTATRMRQVLVERLDVRELAGHPERYEVTLALREHTEPPAAESGVEEMPGSETAEEVQQQVSEEAEEAVEDTADLIAVAAGVLRVEIELAVEAAALDALGILVEGTTEAGEAVTLTIESHSSGVYSRDDVPAGNYSVRAFQRSSP
jgi:hypothetical protein